MLKFPMKFEVACSSSSGITTPWTSKTNHQPPVKMAIPPEFMGPGGGYSPEDLFAMSVLNCVIATFKVYAEKSKLSFQDVTGKAQLTVDKSSEKPGFSMTHLDLSFDIKGASDKEAVEKVMYKAIEECAVSNSVKSSKTFHVNVAF